MNIVYRFALITILLILYLSAAFKQTDTHEKLWSKEPGKPAFTNSQPVNKMNKPYVPKFLESAFEMNFTCTGDSGSKYDFYLSEPGKLTVNSGKIIACDPFLYNDDLAFTATFPTGEFPVQLAIAKVNNDERVGFARIKFSDEMPATWIMAACNGQDIETLNAESIFGYPVDSGTGAFMDSLGAKVFDNFLKEKIDNYTVIIDETNKNYRNTWSWLLWKKQPCSVAMFSSGWGDGYYASYIGYDINNKICRLVTDFDIIE